MKNEGDNTKISFLWTEARKNEHICTSTIEGLKKKNVFIPKLSKAQRK